MVCWYRVLFCVCFLWKFAKKLTKKHLYFFKNSVAMFEKVCYVIYRVMILGYMYAHVTDGNNY